jgi:hypothetical protein
VGMTPMSWTEWHDAHLSHAKLYFFAQSMASNLTFLSEKPHRSSDDLKKEGCDFWHGAFESRKYVIVIAN